MKFDGKENAVRNRLSDTEHSLFAGIVTDNIFKFIAENAKAIAKDYPEIFVVKRQNNLKNNLSIIVSISLCLNKLTIIFSSKFLAKSLAVCILTCRLLLANINPT